MAEELSFARKASGLVRGLSLWDAFGIGLMTTMPIYATWYIVQVGLGLFPGGNLLIALALSALLCGISAPLVWGILAASMPRSGGEYIFNSRVISPAIAIGASFANIVAIVYWNLFMATWIANPSLSMLAGFMGYDGLGEFVAGKWGIFLTAAVCIIGGFFSVAFGVKIMKTIQKPLLVIGIGGPVILAIALTLQSKESFIAYWNELAVKYGSLDYNAFIAAAGDSYGSALPGTWDWGSTFGTMAAVSTVFIFAYVVAYVAGEVKRPDKTMMKASWLAIAVPLVITVWSVGALYRLVDFKFLSAAGINELYGGVEGYTFPFTTSYMSLAWLASSSSTFIAFVAAITFMLASFWVVSINFALVSRTLFAWGMDRMGPKWFTNINPRWSSPVGLYAIFAVVQIVLVAIYVLVVSNALTGLVATGMQLVSVWAITAISAILLPFRGRAKGIWESSPFKHWVIGRVPVVTIAGVIYLAYILLLIYYAFLHPATRDLTGKNLALFAGVWALGIVWYLYWRGASKKAGVDLGVTQGALPPE